MSFPVRGFHNPVGRWTPPVVGGARARGRALLGFGGLRPFSAPRLRDLLWIQMMCGTSIFCKS